MAATPKYDTLVGEILDIWDEFANSEGNLDLGKGIEDLLGMIATFCKKGDYGNAVRCCRMVLDLIEQGWDNVGRRQLDAELANGVAEFYLGTSCVGQKKLETAIDYFKASSAKLTLGHCTAAAAIWFSMGKIYSFRQEWTMAIWAFQRALNYLTPRKTPTLEDKIDKQFAVAKSGLAKVFHTATNEGHIKEVTPEEERANVRRIQIVRRIMAGPPSAMGEAVMDTSFDPDNVHDTITLDTAHLKGAELGLLVTGSSMIDAGIRDGDYALIRPIGVASDGDVVAAAIFLAGEGGDAAEATLKKFSKKLKPCPHIDLQPMNAAEKHIIVIPSREDLEIIRSDYARQGIDIMIKRGEVRIIGKFVALWRKAEK